MPKVLDAQTHRQNPILFLITKTFMEVSVSFQSVLCSGSVYVWSSSMISLTGPLIWVFADQRMGKSWVFGFCNVFLSPYLTKWSVFFVIFFSGLLLQGNYRTLDDGFTSKINYFGGLWSKWHPCWRVITDIQIQYSGIIVN